MRKVIVAATSAIAALCGGAAWAATDSVSLSGQVANFQPQQFSFNHDHYDRFILNLTGLDSSNAFSVSNGDTIDATVTLDQAYTIPASQLYTNILLILTGSSFPNEGTAETGTFSFYNHGNLVDTFNYSSSTASSLASYAAVFPPSNTAITFDSFTDNFTITNLATPATLDGSYFFYDLVSAQAPEPGVWILMFAGLGLAGARLRRAARTAVA